MESLDTKLDAAKLEKLNDALQKINEKQLSAKWKALDEQCENCCCVSMLQDANYGPGQTYMNDNMMIVQDQIATNFIDLDARQDFENNVLKDSTFFAEAT